MKAILSTLLLIGLCICEADEGDLFPGDSKASAKGESDPWKITEPIPEISTLIVSEGKIDFPSQTLFERVKLINHYLGLRKFASHPQVIIEADVEADKILCEPFSLARPTLGLIIKYTLSNRRIYPVVNGHQFRITQCGSK